MLGAVNRKAGERDIMVAAAGGLPGELHKLWRTGAPKGYHLEYGYSCMGYEIAGGLGVKLAFPDRRVIVLVGDGSYLMMNSEIATAVMMGLKLDIVVLDNRGFGCINRLQQAVGDRPFNNLLADVPNAAAQDIDFAMHARSLGAESTKVGSIAELEAALERAESSPRTHVIVIETDPAISTRGRRGLVGRARGRGRGARRGPPGPCRLCRGAAAPRTELDPHRYQRIPHDREARDQSHRLDQ